MHVNAEWQMCLVLETRRKRIVINPLSSGFWRGTLSNNEVQNLWARAIIVESSEFARV